jgi:lysozyme
MCPLKVTGEKYGRYGVRSAINKNFISTIEPIIVVEFRILHDVFFYIKMVSMKKNNRIRKNYKLLLVIIIMSGMFTMTCTRNPGANDRKPSETSTSTPAKETRGIDVSHYSGAVDWTKVKAAGYTFAFAKATEGMDDKDPMFAVYWPAMKKAGLIRGAYHFYVTEDDPEKQAQFFIQTVKLKKGDLAPVVDIEILGKDTKPGLASRFRTFLDILEKHYGIRPIIYTERNFWNRNLDNTFGSFPLWLAEYDVESPRLPLGWSTYYLWQWKGDAQVPGVEKTADLSKLNSKEQDFSQLLLNNPMP